MNLQPVKELISKQLNASFGSVELFPVGGGSINQTYRLSLNKSKHYFLKVNTESKFPGLFEKERNGLEFLAKQNCIRTPSVIYCDRAGDQQLLLLEWIGSGPRTEDFWKVFGEQLARLHHFHDPYFGFYEDNYMGSLTQLNRLAKTWSEFFIYCRLQPQIELALRNDLLQKNHATAFYALAQKLDSIFDIERPSLLHGDLWSGNFMCNESSMPVLIDPAVYFGHRSIDLGMTTLFGGFDKVFYDAYHYHFPLPSNYHEQWEISNLYPLLIHLNLFGSGYLHQIESTIKRYS